ncbi:MAG: 4-hydroxy-tetrahydrodipicolinate reductase [Firmicutes bacterium]|nr:4-hydroxy-tetrahydrodipicolinate reductase [Bacillota bacterium]
MQKLRVMVVGACGKMGRQVVTAVSRQDDLELAGAVNRSHAGEDIGVIAGIGPIGVAVNPDFDSALTRLKPDVMVDFAQPDGLTGRIRTAIHAGVHPVVGTTGLTQAEVDEIRDFAKQYGLGAVIAPNFAVGALLMMRFAEIAAGYFTNAEIIELHHDRKLDSPSGTAIKTAEMMAARRSAGATLQTTVEAPAAEPAMAPETARKPIEKIRGARGGELAGIHIHSVRLPGFVAHQEVILGNPGETLTIRHDSIDRESFMPGVLLAVRKVVGLREVVYGLESLVFGQ